VARLEEGRRHGELKVDGKAVTAQRVAWVLAHGALPHGAEVRACSEVKAYVRIEHLSVRGDDLQSAVGQAGRGPARKGTGSITWVRDGVCKMTVTAGRYEDGRQRRLSETVQVGSESEAARAAGDGRSRVRRTRS
jgi:hypothetical protein